MVITLYKSCKFNQSYNEVLDTIKGVTYNNVSYTNTLEAYLSTLTKYTITSEEPIFFTNSGKFPFEYDLGLGGNIYDYNYMKVDEVIPKDENTNVTISRYFFINSITLVNIIAVAEYTEDIWANYSKSMHIRKSLLTRSRATKYGSYTVPFYKLGMEYEGNNEIVPVAVQTDDYREADIGKCMIVAQIQIYQLVVGSGGGTEKSNVVTRTVWIYSRETQGQSYTDKYYFDVNDSLTKYLTNVVVNQTSKKFIFTNDYKTTYSIYQTGDWYYEISNFVLIPKSFGIKMYNVTDPANYMGYVDQIVFNPNDEIRFADLYRVPLTATQEGVSYQVKLTGGGIYSTHFSITNNFTNIGIGTVTNIYDIVNNGSSIDGSILVFGDDYNFNVMLSMQNQLINITDNFNIEVPISVQSADVTQQAKTSRELEKMNAGLQIGHSGIQFLQSGIQMATSGAMATLGAMTGQVGSIASGVSGMGSSLGSIYSGVSNLAKGIKSLQILNRPLYRTNKGTFSKSVGVANARYGLILYQINADNTTEVQANIDNAGYVVNEIVDDILQNMANDNNRPTYNVLSFDYVNNYGSFPENIRQQLVEILTNGTKIWYDTASYIAS